MTAPTEFCASELSELKCRISADLNTVEDCTSVTTKQHAEIMLQQPRHRMSMCKATCIKETETQDFWGATKEEIRIDTRKAMMLVSKFKEAEIAVAP